MSICKTWQEGDEYACSCGLRWALDDNDPHSNAKKAKAQAHIRDLRKQLGGDMAEQYKKVVSESTAKQIAARNDRNRSAANVASASIRRGIDDHMERKRLREETQTELSAEDKKQYARYCFECECNGEIPQPLGVKK